MQNMEDFQISLQQRESASPFWRQLIADFSLLYKKKNLKSVKKEYES